MTELEPSLPEQLYGSILTPPFGRRSPAAGRETPRRGRAGGSSEASWAGTPSTCGSRGRPATRVRSRFGGLPARVPGRVAEGVGGAAQVPNCHPGTSGAWSSRPGPKKEVAAARGGRNEEDAGPPRAALAKRGTTCRRSPARASFPPHGAISSRQPIRRSGRSALVCRRVVSIPGRRRAERRVGVGAERLQSPHQVLRRVVPAFGLGLQEQRQKRVLKARLRHPVTPPRIARGRGTRPLRGEPPSRRPDRSLPLSRPSKAGPRRCGSRRARSARRRPDAPRSVRRRPLRPRPAA